MAALMAHSWPGNVRELENLMRRLAALCPDEVIGREAVERELGPPAEAALPAAEAEGFAAQLERYLRARVAAAANLQAADLHAEIVAEIEAPLIRLTLAATRGNQIRAAALLGLNRNTLRKKLRELGIDVVRGPAAPAELV